MTDMPIQDPLQRTCPLCEGPNACALASGGSFAEPCWCAAVAFGSELLDRVPPAGRGVSCICAACATAPRNVSSIERMPSGRLHLPAVATPVEC
jgi:hypothetical protein